MVSEVANKSFENKAENSAETEKSDLFGSNNESVKERIEPSFLDSTEQKSTGHTTYDDTFDRGMVNEDDNMNIPSFLRRNRD